MFEFTFSLIVPNTCQETKKSVLKFVQQHVPEMTEEGLIKTISKGGEGLTTKSKRWWTLDPIDGTLGYVT